MQDMFRLSRSTYYTPTTGIIPEPAVKRIQRCLKSMALEHGIVLKTESLGIENDMQVSSFSHLLHLTVLVCLSPLRQLY